MGDIPKYPNPSAQMIAEGNCQGRCETCEGKEICWKDDFSVDQENREKEIAELEKSLPHFISNDTRRYIAFKLRNKGYRKEEDVQKETLKDVMSYLHELSRDDMYTEEGYCFDFIERMFCEKFGVEKATSSSNSKPEVVE